ncbi:MAG: class I SAM-dependent methyltransferase [Actinomycetota bacterium]|nr:class I SAM-dependent methyltransferase [Actinomycetota bacterium]
MEARHWFEDVADHLGEAYLRYSFTKGTDQEVAFLVEELGLVSGMRVLDVGCGPGRHAHALARSGLEVVGVDISERFVELARRDAPPGATFVRGDARALGYDGEFDAVISLCQGGFGLSGGPGSPIDPDGDVLAGMAGALRPRGLLALSAFSAYFQIRHLDEFDSFDAERGVHHEVFEVRDPDGRSAEYGAWTTCFTPRELRLMIAAAGLELMALWSVEPGGYARHPPDLDHPEFLLVARQP